MHPAIIIGTVRSLWTWLWGRYHVPQNVFLVAYNLIIMPSPAFTGGIRQSGRPVVTDYVFKVKVRQRRPEKSCKLDSSWSWTTERILTITFTNISYSWATHWLSFQSHGFKGQSHRNVFRWRHTDRRLAAEDHQLLCCWESLAFVYLMRYISIFLLLLTFNDYF